MYFSSLASFGFATVLAGTGVLCITKAVKTDKRYLPLAIMPLAAGIQQLAEGMIWTSFEYKNMSMATSYAFLYLFFLWIFWPAWTGLATAMLEPHQKRKYVFFGFAAAGLALGAIVYIPYIWHPEWMHVSVNRFSLAYSNSRMLPDLVMPRDLTHAIFLFLVCAPLLISSHANLRLFGATLLIFVSISFFMFTYAFASVLCFFAAISSIHILYIIMNDKCRDPKESFNDVANQFPV